MALEKAKNDFEKAERLARTTNKSTFMNLGDKQLGLVSEERPSSKKRYPVEDPIRATSDDFYISDDSIPSEMFMLIQKYREIIINSRGG